MATKHRSLDDLVERAAGITVELRAAEANIKLSPSAFLKEALATANCSVDRLAQIEAALNDRPGLDVARNLVRTMARQFREPNYSRPPINAGKMTRIFGHEQAAVQLINAGISLEEMVALAARIATEQWPESFGPIEDFDGHQALIADLRRQLDALYAAMRTAWTADDLVVERAAYDGLVRVTFKCAPRVGLNEQDYPAKLVTVALDARKAEAA